jgi:IS30 family transposase
VSRCDVCQKVKDKIVTTRPALNSIPVHSTWHHIRIDFVGPIAPETNAGNRYILTISDYFSKWVAAVPLPTKEAVGVVNELFKLFMIMGLPRLITTDQGREFNNLLNKEFMKKLNIKHNLATPYHPQSNGLDERFNQTLQRMLVKFCNSDKTNWDEYLNTCVFAYNTSRHESSLYSPFEVMF